jgi:hypothetical protein
MACPQVRGGMFVAARQTDRAVVTTMVRMAAKVIEIA